MSRTRRRLVCRFTAVMFLVSAVMQPVLASGPNPKRSGSVTIRWAGPNRLDTTGRRTRGHWIPRASSTLSSSSAQSTRDDRDWLEGKVTRLPKEFRFVGERIAKLIRLHDWVSIESRGERRFELKMMGISTSRTSVYETDFRFGGQLKATGSLLMSAAPLSQRVSLDLTPDGSFAHRLSVGDEIDEQPIVEAIAEYEDAIAYSIASEESLEDEMAYLEGLNWGSELVCSADVSGPLVLASEGDNCFMEGAAAVGTFLRGIADVRSARDAIVAAANTFVNTIDDIYTQFSNGQITQGAANAAVAAASTALRSAVGYQALGIAGAVILTAAVAYIAYECIFGLPI